MENKISFRGIWAFLGTNRLRVKDQEVRDKVSNNFSEISN